MYRVESLRPETDFVDRVEDFLPETEKIERALFKAIDAHEGQFRKSGEVYVNHCVAVASILQSWGICQEGNEDLFCAALLHDAVEDTEYGLGEIEGEFGDGVASLVDGVSKFRSEEKTSKKNIDKETLRKVVMKTFVDPRVGLLKLADRLHNMRTLEAMSGEKRVAKAWETLTVYVPLAESLGVWVVKTELEDLAFANINSDKYEKVRRELDRDPRLTLGFIEGMVEKIEGLMETAGMLGKVGIRVGGYWKSYKKRERSGMRGMSGLGSFADINDVLSIGVKLEEINDCYRFLGMLRQYFGILVDESRADDFIYVAPRDNGYMALQETIVLEEGAVEVAIMTERMEEFNNWGVVSLLRRNELDLSDYQLKLLFTPAGDVRFLPVEANGVDLAATLNRSLLAGMVGVKVDGDDWGLGEPLPNGSTVEIVTGDSGREVEVGVLLEHELLPRTERMVKDLLRQKERDALVEKGEGLMEAVLRDRGLFCLGDILGIKPGWSNKVNGVLFEFGCENLRDLYYKFGSGALGSERLTKCLDEMGINKLGLGLTSVSLFGINRQGVLAEVTEVISFVGGDIMNLKLIWVGENRYRLRLVIDGLLDKEKELRDLLERDNRFGGVEVV